MTLTEEYEYTYPQVWDVMLWADFVINVFFMMPSFVVMYGGMAIQVTEFKN